MKSGLQKINEFFMILFYQFDNNFLALILCKLDVLDIINCTKNIYVQNIFKIYNIYFTYIVDEKLYN